MSTSALAEWVDLLRSRLTGLLELSDGQLEALYLHYEALVRWNRVLNLTAIRDPNEVIDRHYFESLFLAAHLPPGALRIADVGSGAGFPGFPVAIARPDCIVSLIESHQRKAVFLKDVSRTISNIRVLAVRAEKVDEGFDYVISRAVSYEDLESPWKRLAPAIGLLTGVEDPPESLGISWVDVIPVPLAKQRFLRFGVSRET